MVPDNFFTSSNFCKELWQTWIEIFRCEWTIFSWDIILYSDIFYIWKIEGKSWMFSEFKVRPPWESSVSLTVWKFLPNYSLFGKVSFHDFETFRNLIPSTEGFLSIFYCFPTQCVKFKRRHMIGFSLVLLPKKGGILDPRNPLFSNWLTDWETARLPTELVSSRAGISWFSFWPNGWWSKNILIFILRGPWYYAKAMISSSVGYAENLK